MRLTSDGLKNVEYELVDYVEEKLYTNITVRILNKSIIRGHFNATNIENTTLSWQRLSNLRIKEKHFIRITCAIFQYVLIIVYDVSM